MCLWFVKLFVMFNSVGLAINVIRVGVLLCSFSCDLLVVDSVWAVACVIIAVGCGFGSFRLLVYCV